jgi:hypothetical protein
MSLLIRSNISFEVKKSHLLMFKKVDFFFLCGWVRAHGEITIGILETT